MSMSRIVFRRPRPLTSSLSSYFPLRPSYKPLSLPSVRLIQTTLPFPTSHDPVSDPPKTPNFVNNTLRPSTTSNWIPLHDPATNTLVTSVPDSTPAELSAAIDAASTAFPSWASTSVISRQAIIFRYTALIRSHMSHLAALITHEQGKTLADARGDVLRGLQVAETACGITTQIPGQVLEVAAGMETRSYRAPLGVVAAICPFNFPAMIPLWSIPVALATGNTIIIKPSERDPGAAVLLAELAREAGVPDGVVGVVNGGRGVVEGLIEDERVKAISFVGSDRAGQEIYQKATAKGKRVQANLGAKNHGVLMPDCDKEEALKAVVGAAFGAAGQRCMALSTLVLVGETAEWEGDLVKQARKLKVNGGFEEDADLGPVISPASCERIEGLIQGAGEEGARILLDGRGFKPAKYPDGNWIAPTIISSVTPSMTCYRTEIFGPVLIVLHAPTLAAALSLINANPYGNGASIFTSSGSAAAHFQRSVNVGQVGINVPIPVPLPMFSFTGNKGSVAGEGSGGGRSFYGPEGLAFYTQWKTVTSLWRAPDETSAGGGGTTMPTQE